MKTIETELKDYFRLPRNWRASFSCPSATGRAGFFGYGEETTCFGNYARGAAKLTVTRPLCDASRDTRIENGTVYLSFDPGQTIENLRKERYAVNLPEESNGYLKGSLVRRTYYFLREFLPVSIRRHFQRAYFRGWESLPFPRWPVDFSVDNLHREMLRLAMQAQGIRCLPFIWFWPEGKPGCLLMTHDVEDTPGRDFTASLMDLDDKYGIKASFQVIPEDRYSVSDEYVAQIKSRGFEFNIHDLNHDGNLYQKHEEFVRRAKKINEYARRYAARGFRAGAMYRNQEWYGSFEFEYDMSVPNVAHLEPMRGGCCTVMPYFVNGILELPLTIAQDYSVFHILQHSTTELWKTQLDLIRERNGLMSIISHPDYLIGSENRKLYETLLEYLRKMIDDHGLWHALPNEINQWWRDRSSMELVQSDTGWKITGNGSDRARLAFAELDGDHLIFRLA